MIKTTENYNVIYNSQTSQIMNNIFYMSLLKDIIIPILKLIGLKLKVHLRPIYICAANIYLHCHHKSSFQKDIRYNYYILRIWNRLLYVNNISQM